MDTGYVNARVRGMHSFLLTRKQLDSLILKPDIDSLITELEKTPYQEDLQRALLTASGVRGIEHALRLNLIRTFQKILSFVKGEVGEKYIHIFLTQWDVDNVKTILRGKKVHIPSQEIRDCLIPAGDLDETTLVELLKQPDIKSVIDLLATWGHDCAVPLTRHFEEYIATSDLVILEYALDKHYFEQSLTLVNGRTQDEQIVRDLIATEIDITNIKILLSLIRDGIDPSEGEHLLLSGGKHLDLKRLLVMLNASTIGELLPHLEQTPYRFLAQLKAPGNSRIKMSAYQNALDQYLIIHGARTFRGDPLSITIIIGYLWAKYNEIINLRIIARCKNAMITPEDMEAELVYV
ncbi:MAG TPA: V-type ATPase subunit [Methanospirillum sp.]|nr:V-type ATPase subunit [Methanospirillum sp.]